MTKRDEILRYLLGKPEGMWPASVREIGAAVDLKSTATVHYHLRRLEREGLVERGPNRIGARAVREAA